MLCLSVELRLALTAGVMPRQRRMEADRMAAPQGRAPCPLPGRARRTGIESGKAARGEALPAVARGGFHPRQRMPPLKPGQVNDLRLLYQPETLPQPF